MKIRNVPIGGGHPLVLFAGPCVVENRELVMKKNVFGKVTIAIAR